MAVKPGITFRLNMKGNHAKTDIVRLNELSNCIGLREGFFMIDETHLQPNFKRIREFLTTHVLPYCIKIEFFKLRRYMENVQIQH